MTVAVLDREMYTLSEGARLLNMSPTTLWWWLDGGERGGRHYRPVIRPEPTGVRTVTWAEFVEAGFLRQYRSKEVPLRELRAFIRQLRDDFGTPYPLAHSRPFVGDGMRLVLAAQDEVGLEPDFCLVAVVGHQRLLLTAPSDAFLTRVDWDQDVASAWRPHDDPRSPVRISPQVRYGSPAVGSISTSVIWEHLEGDESFAEVANQFDLTINDVRWAHAYETSARTAKAA
jgi:uncharacterized protein (DUF433 family)